MGRQRQSRGGVRLGKSLPPDKLRAWLREDWKVRSVAHTKVQEDPRQFCSGTGVASGDGWGGEVDAGGVTGVEMPLGHSGNMLRDSAWRNLCTVNGMGVGPKTDLDFPRAPKHFAWRVRKASQ